MSATTDFLAHLGAGIARAWRSGLVRSGVGLGALTSAQMVLGLVTAVILARELGVAGLGVYSFAMAAAMLAALPVESGLPSLVKREIAHAAASEASSAEKGVIVFALSLIALSSAVLVAIILVYGRTLAGGHDSVTRAIIPLAALLIPVTVLGRVLGAALAGRQRVALGAVPDKLVRPGAFAIALALVAALEPGWLTPVHAMGLQVAASAVAAAFGAALCLRHFANTLRHGRANVPWRAWLATIVRLGLSGGMMQAHPRLLLLLTGGLASVEEVGLLTIAQRGAGVVNAGTTIATIAAAPRVASLYAAGAHERVQRLVTLVARTGFGLSAVGLAAFLLAGGWLLAAIFGPAFVAAWSTLIVLTASNTVRMLLGPGVMLMNMLRHEGVALRGFAIGLGLSLTSAGVLIPYLGALGAACAAFVGISSMALFLRHQARRRLRLDPAAFAGIMRPR